MNRLTHREAAELLANYCCDPAPETAHDPLRTIDWRPLAVAEGNRAIRLVADGVVVHVSQDVLDRIIYDGASA